MLAWAKAHKRAKELLRRAWAALGLPLGGDVLHEGVEGGIDPEALVVTTLLCDPAARYAVDIVAWITTHRDLINHQKLKVILSATSQQHPDAIRRHVKDSIWRSAAPLARLLETAGVASQGDAELIKKRQSKLANIADIAVNSCFIKNRLLFGTGARADVISVLEASNAAMSGVEIASLVGASPSSVSRILADLQACRYINQKNRLPHTSQKIHGVCISARTPAHVVQLLEAQRFKNEVLVQQVIKDMNVEGDRFTEGIIATLD